MHTVFWEHPREVADHHVLRVGVHALAASPRPPPQNLWNHRIPRRSRRRDVRHHGNAFVLLGVVDLTNPKRSQRRLHAWCRSVGARLVLGVALRNQLTCFDTQHGGKGMKVPKVSFCRPRSMR